MSMRQLDIRSFAVTLSFCIFAVQAVMAAAAADENLNHTSSWPIYHGDSGLRGRANCSLPSKLSVLWRYKVGASISMAPVVGGGTIILTADNGELHSVKTSGEKAWAVAIQNPPAGTNVNKQVEQFSSPPLFCNGKVIVGSDAGYLYAVLHDTGKTIWKFHVGENVVSTANWIERNDSKGAGVVVISQAEGGLVRVDLEKGTKVWTTEPVARSDGSPGVGKDFVVFGSCDAALHFFSSADGSIKKRINLEGDGQIAGGVAVDGNLVFAGTRGGLAVCADVSKSAIVWTNQISNSETFATPALTDDRLITGANDGRIYCLDRNGGKIIWKTKVRGDPLSPVVAGDKVVVSSGGTLYMLSLKDGAELWSDKHSDTITSPAVFDEKVVVGTDDGFLIMYGAGK